MGLARPKMKQPRPRAWDVVPSRHSGEKVELLFSIFMKMRTINHYHEKSIYIIVITILAALASCEKSTPVYQVEGKWLWSPSENRADANTIYEFVDGTIYTSYCITCPGDDDYWNSLDSTDRIPGAHSYTFDGDTLVWDGTPRAVTFECDGGKLVFSSGMNLWRLSSDCQ